MYQSGSKLEIAFQTAKMPSSTRSYPTRRMVKLKLKNLRESGFVLMGLPGKHKGEAENSSRT